MAPTARNAYQSVFAPGLFQGQVVVVTGGGSGIGRCAAHELAHLGAQVVLVGRKPDKLQAVAEEIAADGGRVSCQVCDIRSEEGVVAMVQQIIAAQGRIDALVNNAGVAVFKPLLEHTFEEWRQVMAVNLDGAFLCTQACAPVMLRNAGDQAKAAGGCGAVVNIASISGLRASALRVAYGTSKAAIIHLTKQQAVELGNMGIRVNAIAPGPVDTDMAKKVHSAAIRADYADAIPLARYGTPEEIAEGVGFLCSPAASYINGQVLAVDGGFDAAGIGLPSLRQP
eukprot:gene40267-53222_t